VYADVFCVCNVMDFESETKHFIHSFQSYISYTLYSYTSPCVDIIGVFKSEPIRTQLEMDMQSVAKEDLGGSNVLFICQDVLHIDGENEGPDSSILASL
jgi:hypothetical protein